MDIATVNTEHLDKELARIDARLIHEKLMDIVPTIKAQFEENRALVAVIHRVACIFQKHQLVIPVDESTGLTPDGYDPDKAKQEVTEVLTILRELAVRYQ